MIQVLDTTNKSIQLKEVANGGSLQFTAAWADITATSLTEASFSDTGNSAPNGDAVIVSAPAANVRRVVKSITIHNSNSSLSCSFIVIFKDSTDERIIARGTLAAGATWYSDDASVNTVNDGDKGDITVSGSGATWTIDNDAITTAKILDANVTLAKIANLTGNRVIGRVDSTGAPQELTLTQTLDFVGSAAQGDILYRDASSWTRLAAGTRGRYLQTGGASANPAWATAAAFKNVLINGDMQVAQRGTSVTGITGSGYNTADRWRVEISSLGTWTQTVETADAPANTEFRRSLKMNCTTADASPAAGDYALIQQRIEGLNLQHFMKGTTNARQFSLSFWVKTSTTGTYIVELFDHTTGANRHVAATYLVNAANMWEFKTITFPADTSGVLANTNALALSVNFWMGSGSTYTGGTLATTWASVTNGNRAAGLNVNLAGATNRYMQITGVQLEPGSVATEFEYLPIDIVINRCLRYFYRCDISGNNGNFLSGVGSIAGGNQAVRCAMSFIVPMRAAPTASFQNAQVFNGTSVFTINSMGAQYSSRYIASLDLNLSGNPGSGTQCQVIENSSAGRFDYDIEL